MNARGERGGFALALVVLMLFAIAVAGVTGYQAVSTELVLSTQNRDAQRALTTARAGLQRYLAEHLGEVEDSVSYAIDDGIATVTARRVLRRDSLNHLYYLRSTGTVADPSAPANPARRTVGTYAWLRRSPIPLKGALWVSGGTVTLTKDASDPSWFWTFVDGHDHSTSSDCAGGGTLGTAGIVVGGSVMTAGGALSGNPGVRSYAGYSAVYDSVKVRWDVLSSPSFPVDYDGAMPALGTVPADTFPIIRLYGDQALGSSESGHGVLIVTGTIVPAFGFTWDGIILAGRLGDTVAGFQINGMFIAGLNGPNPNVTLQSGHFFYNACAAYAANKALSHLEVVDRAIFEING